MIGIECRTSNSSEEGPYDIPQLWNRFYSEDIISKIPNKVSSEVVALYCDYEGDYTKPYSLIIGCAVTSLFIVPEGMVAKMIPGGFYALFTAIGEYPACLIETWGAIWQIDLKRTYTGDYELYGDRFTSRVPKEVDIFIAIDKEVFSDA